MEIRLDILLIIIGCAIVTFIPRVVPLMVLSRLNIPDWGLRWLSYVPISIMAALIAQELFIEEDKLRFISGNLKLFAAIPTLAVAIWTRSLLGTVLTGILSMMLLRLWL